MNIKLSIIIIGYNIEGYVNKCLNSIFKQDLTSTEVIFVDDGSTDNTATIVKNIFTGKINVKYIFQKNQGANSARLTGYKNSKGKYITFIDGDDEISDNYLKVIGDYLDKEFDIITYNYLTNNSGFKFINKKYEIGNWNGYTFLEKILLSKIPHYLWNKIYKRQFLKDINFQNIPKITMGDDIVANVFLVSKMPNVLSIPDQLYIYNYSNTSVSRFFNPKFLELIKMLNEIQKILKENNIYIRYYKCVEYQYFRVFVYYVVNNKSDSSIPYEIYKKYKSQNIIIKNNKYIKDWLKQMNVKEKILLYLYLLNYNVGKKCSNIYLKIKGVNIYEKGK